MVPKEQWPLLALTGLLDLVVQTIRWKFDREKFRNFDNVIVIAMIPYDTIDHHDSGFLSRCNV